MGHVQAVLANIIWGGLPLYFYMLKGVSPWLILSVQIISTYLVAVLFTQANSRTLCAARKSRVTVKHYVPALLLLSNWGLYATALQAGFAREATYTYLIVPVLLSLLSLKVKAPNRRSLLCVLVAICAIVSEAAISGALPLIGLLIAMPFAGYVAWHKKHNIEPLYALRKEIAIMLPPGIVLFMYTFEYSALSDKALILPVLGLLTFLPLALFVSAAKSVQFAYLSVYQFLSPVLGTTVSVVFFEQGFSADQVIAYSIIILAITLNIAVQGNRNTAAH